MHELELPRRYRTIYVCGGLGLGSTREQDQQALGRLYAHLEHGGRLILDNEVPYSDARRWALWPTGGEGELPEPSLAPSRRMVGSDGDEYALVSRMLDLDPVRQQQVWQIHAYRWRKGLLIAEETHHLTCNVYFCGELVMMLERAGFSRVEVRGAYNDLPPKAGDKFLVYLATHE